MSINYTWKITGLRRINSSDIKNIVVHACWQKIGTDSDGNMGVFIGSSSFNSSNIDVDEFIEYKDLTENTVLEWIKEHVANNYGMGSIDQQIEKLINEKINPVIETNNEFPWGTLQPSAMSTDVVNPA